MLRTVSVRALRPSSSSRPILTAASGRCARACTSSTSLMTNAQSPARLSQISSHLSAGAARTMSQSATAQAASSPGAGKSGSGGGDDGSEPKVITTHNGASTTILLNRPKALNAIDTEMVHLIGQGIDAAPKENHIVLRGKGRALCSGGDVLAVVNAANSEDAGTRQEALTFFKDEFELDYKIATLDSQSKPQVLISVMDGITMGGGVGLSVNAPIRIATEKTMFAMPETGIGYWPDVGVTRNLARLDGQVGVYLGMTGARISGEEAYLTGLATHFIPSTSIDEALRRLSVVPRNSTAEKLADTLDEFSTNPFDPSANERANDIISKSAFVGSRRIALDYVFGQRKAEDVLTALEQISKGDAESSRTGKELLARNVDVTKDGVQQWAASTLKTLKTKSPRSLKVTFIATRNARRHDVAQAFDADMRLATAFCDFGVGRDFYEGVTFTLTKDPETGKRREGIAKWNPDSLEAVDDNAVQDIFFGPLTKAKEAGLTMEVPSLQGVALRKSSGQQQQIGPLGWEKGYNRLALPSEAEIEALREGSHPSAGDYELKEAEIVSILRSVKQDKPSIEFKVKEWLRRRSQTGGL